ncbi:nucleoside ABC transporter membrane protein [Muricomes intestini]|mgnify:CR=1 FL=1|jgi:simple sugar transport system permease protein|uniref:Nucleoside ABC transporter membrane protein n=4 Tax=Muricomes intestini TaxID=1796634 RepID=A0A4R3K331_9FIRM|nr:ABC transporter permease [Muricomes intestini]TCS77090.1 nucleoside ABC transporter membrane protein [Muricomes intestini]HAX51602.1 sugar ABC transporter permease [Lachnospiraceae bacterium]
MLSSITLFIGITLMYSTPLAFAALGGVVSERSGVTNLGIEGMMTIGAFTGATVGYFTGSAWGGFLAAGAAGGMIALLHAFASITCRADQTISGIAINLIGPGVALFICRILFDGATMTVPVTNKIPKLFGSAGGSGALKNLNVDVTVVVALALAVLLWVFLYKTKWGFHIRAVGEHPAAADTMGIHVYRIRYLCVIVSGILAGFGGASMTLAIIPQFTPTAISGQGFIALAAVIFGKWTPHGAYGACLLFGAAQALTVILGGGSFQVPSEILAMLPYVITIIILILFVGRSAAPKASGQPYEKGER